MRTWIVAATAAVGLALIFSTHRIAARVNAATTSDQTGPSGIALPPGYRDWALISVAAVGPPLSDIRAKLGNDIAMTAFRQGTTPYPDGTIMRVWRGSRDRGIRKASTPSG
jgi:hypothetical protein